MSISKVTIYFFFNIYIIDFFLIFESEDLKISPQDQPVHVHLLLCNV